MRRAGLGKRGGRSSAAGPAAAQRAGPDRGAHPARPDGASAVGSGCVGLPHPLGWCWRFKRRGRGGEKLGGAGRADRARACGSRCREPTGQGPTRPRVGASGVGAGSLCVGWGCAGGCRLAAEPGRFAWEEPWPAPLSPFLAQLDLQRSTGICS